jgi:hypothetical protein
MSAEFPICCPLIGPKSSDDAAELDRANENFCSVIKPFVNICLTIGYIFVSEARLIPATPSNVLGMPDYDLMLYQMIPLAHVSGSKVTQTLS